MWFLHGVFAGCFCMVFALCLRGVWVVFGWCLGGVCVVFAWCLCMHLTDEVL